MNESIDWKSALAFTVKDAHKGVLMRLRCVAMFAALVFANLPAAAFAQSSPCPGLHVKILIIGNSVGNIGCALFESPVGFPIEFLRYATNIIEMKIQNIQARCDFVNIPPRTYALAAIDDENFCS